MQTKFEFSDSEASVLSKSKSLKSDYLLCRSFYNWESLDPDQSDCPSVSI